ncbi:hypothetical protein IHE44_0001659, partial [Lamprotornis superbus]
SPRRVRQVRRFGASSRWRGPARFGSPGPGQGQRSTLAAGAGKAAPLAELGKRHLIPWTKQGGVMNMPLHQISVIPAQDVTSSRVSRSKTKEKEEQCIQSSSGVLHSARITTGGAGALGSNSKIKSSSAAEHDSVLGKSAEQL